MDELLGKLIDAQPARPLITKRFFVRKNVGTETGSHNQGVVVHPHGAFAAELRPGVFIDRVDRIVLAIVSLIASKDIVRGYVDQFQTVCHAKPNDICRADDVDVQRPTGVFVDLRG